MKEFWLPLSVVCSTTTTIGSMYYIVVRCIQYFDLLAF